MQYFKMDQRVFEHYGGAAHADFCFKVGFIQERIASFYADNFSVLQFNQSLPLTYSNLDLVRNFLMPFDFVYTSTSHHQVPALVHLKDL